jgi:hypothetical protein
MKPPEVFIPKQVWTLIMNNAAKFSGKHGDETAFGLFADRRSGKRIPSGYLGNHYIIREIKEIPLRHVKPNFWLFDKQKERGFYPKEGLRYVGTVEIQNNINLSQPDAYWFGREKIDIKIFVNSSGQFKAYWVDHKIGEFFEITPRIV